MNELQKALNVLEIGFLEGTVSREVIEKARAQADELSKGGEGSRGGKIIGHTKSGKPIYATNARNIKHKEFNPSEHREAAVKNREEATKIYERARKVGPGLKQREILDDYELHQQFASEHEEQAKLKEGSVKKSIDNDLEKGKSMPIGTIHNGFKKIAEGKWRKVSEYDLTKEEHEYQSKYAKEEAARPTIHSAKHESNSKWHSDEASKLDSKEYSDVDVHGKEEKEGGINVGDIFKNKESGKKYEIVNISKLGSVTYKVEGDNQPKIGSLKEFTSDKFEKNKAQEVNEVDWLKKHGGIKDFSGKGLMGSEEQKKNKVVVNFPSKEAYDRAKKDFENLPKHIQDNLSTFDSTENRIILHKSISPDLQKAITTLEIGHLLGQVSAETLEKARGYVTPLGTVVRRADGKDWKKTSNGWEPVKKESGVKTALDQPDMNEGTKDKMFGKEKEGVGEKFTLKTDSDMPISLQNLKGKELTSTGKKVVKFASGDQIYYTFKVDGDEVEVSERFLEKKGEESKESSIEDLKKQLKESKDSSIISATNSYKHTPNTISQIKEKISVLDKMESAYEKEMDVQRKLEGKNAWDRYSELAKKQQGVKNAKIAYEMASAASEILQKHKANAGAGMSDIQNQMTMFSGVRSLLYMAKDYEKDVL
jgi:hypothetical protein